MTTGRPRCDFWGYEALEPVVAFSWLAESKVQPNFRSEAEYRDWFVDEALSQLLQHLYPDVVVSKTQKEAALFGSGYRIDVLVSFEGGKKCGFELKSVNPRHPQTAKAAIMQGVGQTLLYYDILNAVGDGDVFLVSDVVHETIPPLIMRHGLPIGVIEANIERILCFDTGRRAGG